MFLLLLMGLGAASVKAQVRIGGNAAPNASAVLDLNADDTNSGNKGLALPRVALTSNQMLLPGVTANLTGMMVYNTSTTGTGVNRIGTYYWNGATWVQASLPSTSSADSGKYLVSNGITWVAGSALPGLILLPSITVTPTTTAVTWIKTAGFSVTLPKVSYPGDSYYLDVGTDLSLSYCFATNATAHITSWTTKVAIMVTSGGAANLTVNVVCYKPSA